MGAQPGDTKPLAPKDLRNPVHDLTLSVDQTLKNKYKRDSCTSYRHLQNLRPHHRYLKTHLEMEYLHWFNPFVKLYFPGNFIGAVRNFVTTPEHKLLARDGS